MDERAEAVFRITNWDEAPYDEVVGGPKLSRAHVTKSYEGDIEGLGTLEYLLVYLDDGSASFVGFERVVGSIGGRSGGLVLHHAGTFRGGEARTDIAVVAGSGTGELRGLRGGASFATGHADHYPITLDYRFE